MFHQFRLQYPRGSLIGELVSVDRGKYLVRVLLQNEGVTLATGLAAAESIEVAEDRARNRAFVALGLEEQVFSVDRKEGTTAMPAAREMSEMASVESSDRSEDEWLTAPVPEPNFSEVGFEFEETSESVAEDFAYPSGKKEPEPAATPSGYWWEQTPLSPPSESDTPPPAFSEPDWLQEPDPVANNAQASPQPKDSELGWDEILAQTDVEIKRLGWTSEQGKKFLMENYGKRSRQRLSKEQLLEFRDHLRAM